MSEIKQTNCCDIPDWAYQAIRAKLENPDTLRKEDITVIYNFEPYLENMQILAYASPSKYDGAFIIFEKVNGNCEEVYSLKTHQIGPVQTNYSDIILTVLEEGSTGFATLRYYIIKHTPVGYQQVWEGLANHYDINGPIKIDVTGSVTINFNSELIHSVLERRYQGNDPNRTISYRKYANVYKYDESAMMYQLVRRY
jgi:hypothetical protein